MRRVNVWLASASSTIAHSMNQGLTRTGCGIDMVGRIHRGLVIDSRSLNPKRIRLCRICWGALSVPKREPPSGLLACEEDNP